MAIYLHLRTKIKPRPFANPSLSRFCSTSDSNDDKADDQASSNSKPLFSSYLSDVKKSLNQQQPSSRSSKPLKSPTSYFSASNPPPPRPSSGVSSLEEIQRNLSEYRRRSSVPPPGDPNVTPSSSSQQISFQELYYRNVIGKSMGNADTAPVTARGRPSMDVIRESLKQLRSSGSSQIDKKGRDPLSSSAFRNSLNLKPSASTSSGISSTLIGGTSTLPASVFGKEMREKEGEGTAATRSKAEFLRMYSHDQLGEKLRALRPEAKGREWFSLEELNERLVKLMEMEEKKNAESKVTGIAFNDLKESLTRLKQSDDEKAKKSWEQRLNIMSQFGKTPTFMMEPPKEHLVEKYFHPDNLSSAEKLKIELAKVRDEFKISESDCGSACVQVAQLTTKIKHLSSVLHKKDKHSRKGLQAMVQRRKRLLKYLRRTDWDSYCFVISKLGLRDNPDLKH